MMGFFLFDFQSLEEPLHLLERDFPYFIRCPNSHTGIPVFAPVPVVIKIAYLVETTDLFCYGITDNSERITAFRYNVMKSYNWVEFLNMIDNSYPLVRARIYVSVYD